MPLKFNLAFLGLIDQDFNAVYLVSVEPDSGVATHDSLESDGVKVNI